MAIRKTRTDAWGEDLPPETRRELYEGFASKDFEREVLPHLSLQGIPAPSRAGWYRFLGRMRRDERLSLVCAVQSSGATAGDMAKVAVDDATAAEAYKGLSVDAAMAGDAKAAALYAQAANAFRDRAQKAEELKLKAAAQGTRDEQLRLAREKFEAAEKRLAAVQGAVDAPQLTDAERVAKIKGIFGMK